MEQFEVLDWNPAAVLGTPPQPSPKGRELENNPNLLFSPVVNREDNKDVQLPEFKLSAIKGTAMEEKKVEDTGGGKAKNETITGIIKEQVTQMVTEIVAKEEYEIAPGITVKQKVNSEFVVLNKRNNLINEQQSIDEINSQIDAEIEVVRPEYVDPSFEKNISSAPMHRLQQWDFRYYFTFNNPAAIPGTLGKVFTPKDYVKFYPSVTTIISQTSPTADFLKKKIGELGYDGYNKWMNELASYGTLFHEVCGNLLASGKSEIEKIYYNTEGTINTIKEFILKKHLNYNPYSWLKKLNDDILAIRQFYLDYHVKPLAIEPMGFWDDGKHFCAGALDIICEMDYTEEGYFGQIYKSGANKGQPKLSKQTKRIKAIIDLKSGRNGFRKDHETQLKMYDMIAETCFDFKADRLYNLSPKEWKDTPSYNLKDQTESRQINKIPHLLGLFFDDYKGPKDIKIISGSLTGTQDYSDVCRKVNAHEFIFQKMYNKQNNQNLLKSN